MRDPATGKITSLTVRTNAGHSKGLKDWNDLLKFPDARAAEPTVPRLVNTDSAVRRMG